LANIKSQIKRNRQNEKRRLRNRNFRGAARTALKDAHTSLASGADTQVSVLTAISALDKAAQKGAIHARSAARRKSRLMKQLNIVGTAGSTESAADKKKASSKSAANKSAEKKTAAPAAKPKKTSTKK
jgi:small subunit ribosomal protein S20